MSERLVRIEELAVGYTPDLPDQKPIFWEDGRGVLFIDRTLQPMPGQIPLVSAGVPVNAVCSTSNLVFLGTQKSCLTYSLITDEFADVTNIQDKSVGDWSFQNFGTWMLGSHGGKLWIWKPYDEEKWPHTTMQEVTDFTARGQYVNFILKCKNFIIAVCDESILWSTDDNPEEWTPEESNMAGDLFIRDIQSHIQGGIATESFLLLCTQNEVIRVDYISRPYVFSYKKLYEGAGVWNKRSICSLNKSIFGFGPSGIWVSDGNGISYIDKNTVGGEISDQLDIQRINSCFCGSWNNIQHVFFFIPILDEGNEEVRCFGFNLENSTWTILNWNRFCSWKQYWVSTSGSLFQDDLKNAQNLGAKDGFLPLPENGQGGIGLGYDGYGEQGLGGVLWFQV